MKKVVDFFKLAERLECEYRLTRMSDGACQSVASHSWNMAMMAIALQPLLKETINMEKVLKMCILHDLPEAVAHDVPLHQQNPDICAKKHDQESCVIAQIVNLLENSEISNCFKEYEKRVSLEARFVKALDRLDTGVQHLCAKDLTYVGGFKDNFYWKLFFSEDFAKSFDFEPALKDVFEEIKIRVSNRLKEEFKIDSSKFIRGENENS